MPDDASFFETAQPPSGKLIALGPFLLPGRGIISFSGIGQFTLSFMPQGLGQHHYPRACRAFSLPAQDPVQQYIRPRDSFYNKIGIALWHITMVFTGPTILLISLEAATLAER